MILFDDIGSFPLPKGMSREWAESAIRKGDPALLAAIESAMKMKLDAGIDVPTYPQFRDMYAQFLAPIREKSDEPFLVKQDAAQIPELAAVGSLARRLKKRLRVRVCVTGPLELYLKEFGGTAYTDILMNLAKSIDRFIRASFEYPDIDVAVISIDEPSLGISPQVMFGEDDLIEALSAASAYAAAHGADTEIHLHSPLHYRLACAVRSINVIGVESAANPSYLSLIDRKELEASDTFLRIGIARTDISQLATVLNEKYGTNVWKEPLKMAEILDMETPEIIARRLANAASIFGEQIKYTGPDCGLGSWPSQELASGLLRNTRAGIDRFLAAQG